MGRSERASGSTVTVHPSPQVSKPDSLPFKTRLIRVALGAAGATFAPLVSEAIRRRDAWVVLLYHRVSPESDGVYQPISPAAFTEHCEFIRRHFTVLPLAELLARWTFFSFAFVGTGVTPRGGQERPD